MGRFLVVATGGAGGDLPPLIAAALALRDRGHECHFVGDQSVAGLVARLGLEVEVLPTKLDLGPRMGSAFREAMASTSGDRIATARPIIEERMTEWARETGTIVSNLVARLHPEAAMTSLFGAEILAEASLPCPGAVINSTFYLGPNPPRPIEKDLAARSLPLLMRYSELLSSVDMVLHATDQLFDFAFDGLPPRHHYVGPLGLWEPPSDPPPYLDVPGEPWVLVAISSKGQDDLPLAHAALSSLAHMPVRVLVTVGPDHRTDEIKVRPSNAYVEQTVSHSAVLKRGRLLVSHAGHGSAMKALWEGKPMVLVPWGRDQPGVADRAHALGVAEVVQRGDDIEVTIAAAIERTFASSEMQRAARAHSVRLKATDPPGTSATLLESLL